MFVAGSVLQIAVQRHKDIYRFDLNAPYDISTCHFANKLRS